MNFFPVLLAAAEESTAETSAAVVAATGHGGTVVSNMTSAALMAGMIIIIGAALAVFLVIKPRIERFGQSMLYGAVSYLFFGYFLSSGIYLALGFIPAVNEFFVNNVVFAQMLRLVLSIIGTSLSVMVGMILVKKSEKYREGIPVNLGEAIMFALGAYIVSLIVGQQLSFDYNYLAVASTINEMGFDETVALMVQNGADFNEAAAQLYAFASRSPWDYFMDNLVYLFQGALLVGMSIMAYGVINKRMSIAFNAISAGLLVLFYVPSAIGAFTELNTFVWTLICAVVAIAALAAGIISARKYLPEDCEMLSKTIKRKEQMKDQKMPKINMPKY